MKEYKELELNRFVIATLDNPTQYLVSEHFGKYSFTDNIQIATKTMNKSIANEIRVDCNKRIPTIDLVVVPLKIEYKLIDENY